MTRYAENTSVPPDRSRAEIERTLERYGATAFMYAWADNQVAIGFQMRGRQIRFLLPMPHARDFRTTPTGRRRSDSQVLEHHGKAVRSRWRALALIVKAKLQAVEDGVTTFEDEFLAHTVLPDNQTVSDWLQPQIEQAYDSGRIPSLLPGGSDTPQIEQGT